MLGTSGGAIAALCWAFLHSWSAHRGRQHVDIYQPRPSRPACQIGRSADLTAGFLAPCHAMIGARVVAADCLLQ